MAVTAATWRKARMETDGTVPPAPGEPRPVRVFLQATDPVVRAGLVAQLCDSEALTVVGDEGFPADVTLVQADVVNEATVLAVKEATDAGGMTVVLVRDLGDASLADLVAAGARGLVRRAEASADHLVSTILAAHRGEAAIPPDLLGRLLTEVRTTQRDHEDDTRWPRKLGITDREARVLTLVADGFDTSEIAAQLFYSERTVKNIIHDVVARHQLSNRTHAVAYAIRQGWI